MDTGVQWSSLPAYPKRAGGKWTTEAKKCRAGVVSAPAWGTESSGKSCLCQSVNGEEGSRPVPSLWQGTKGSLTKPLMSPVTLWYFPPHLSSIYPPASLSQVPGPASEKGAWLAGQPWVSPASLGFGFPSLKRGGWPGVISWVLRRQCCSVVATQDSCLYSGGGRRPSCICLLQLPEEGGVGMEKELLVGSARCLLGTVGTWPSLTFISTL